MRRIKQSKKNLNNYLRNRTAKLNKIQRKHHQTMASSDKKIQNIDDNNDTRNSDRI